MRKLEDDSDDEDNDGDDGVISCQIEREFAAKEIFNLRRKKIVK